MTNETIEPVADPVSEISTEPSPRPSPHEVRGGLNADFAAELESDVVTDAVTESGVDTVTETGGEAITETGATASDVAWHLRGILESLVFAADRPVKAVRLARLARSSVAEIKVLLDQLASEYRGRGIQLVEVGGGWQFRTNPANASFVREINQTRPVRLSRAQMETLAIIAYRQPVTRPELEDIRGVDSGSALKFLLERETVKVIGRKEEAGRPLLYGTTPHFLELFGLASLRELPTLRELSELTDESKKLFEKRAGEPFTVEGEPAEPNATRDDDADADLDAEPGAMGPPAATPDAASADERAAPGFGAEPEDAQTDDALPSDGSVARGAGPTDDVDAGEDEDDDVDAGEDEDDDGDADEDEDDDGDADEVGDDDDDDE